MDEIACRPLALMGVPYSKSKVSSLKYIMNNSKPKRFKGVYRAAKRGESWAISIIASENTNPMTFILRRTYWNCDLDSIVYSKNPLLDYSFLPK